MAYIAVKPARFDKDYAIGELIPDGVIEAGMEGRLIGWGKIQKAGLPAAPEAPAGRPHATPEAPDSAEGTNVPHDPENAPEGKSEGIAEDTGAAAPEQEQTEEEVAGAPAPEQTEEEVAETPAPAATATGAKSGSKKK
jgi:hypothetical protein